MEIKDILLKLRTKNSLSQDELAERIFVTRQAVSRWENGETVPNTETLKLLSKLFDVSIHWLLCFNEYCIYSNNPTIETIFDLYKLSNAYTKEAVKTFVKHLAN